MGRPATDHNQGAAAEAAARITLGLTLANRQPDRLSAMVGAVGGEGLGDLGIRYGFINVFLMRMLWQGRCESFLIVLLVAKLVAIHR